MYWRCKIKQLIVRQQSVAHGTSTQLVVTLYDDAYTITTEIQPRALCSDFADVLLKLGLYDNQKEVFIQGIWPSSLLNIEVETSISAMAADATLEYIELTPEALVKAYHYAHSASNISNRYNKDNIFIYETPISTGMSITGLRLSLTDSSNTISVLPANSGGIGIPNLNIYNEVSVVYTGISVPPFSDNNQDAVLQWCTGLYITPNDAIQLGNKAEAFIQSICDGPFYDPLIVIDSYDNGYGKGLDKYGRYIGVVYVKDKDGQYINLNKTLLARGLAKPYVSYDSSGKIRSAIPTITAWSYLSPFAKHLLTDDEKAADSTFQRIILEERHQDIIGGGDGPSNMRRINVITITPWPPMTPSRIAEIFHTTVEEIISVNGLDPSVGGNGGNPSEDILEREWYGKRIKVPVYIDPKEYYGVDVKDASAIKPDNKAVPKADNSPKFEDTSTNPIPCAYNTAEIKIPVLDVPYGLRLGDLRFVIPPTSISVTVSSKTNTLKPLRTTSSILTQTGYSAQLIEVQMYFHSLDAINGYPIDNPDPAGTDKYYIDGLRPLIALFKKAPIVPIENELINKTYNIHEVALKNIKIDTVDGFPNVLMVTLQLLPFDITSIMPQCNYLDDVINWPMFRWYYQQAMQPTRTQHLLKKVNGLTNKITFSLADEQVLQQRMEYIRQLRSLPMPYQYEAASKERNKQVQKANEASIKQIYADDLQHHACIFPEYTYDIDNWVGLNQDELNTVLSIMNGHPAYLVEISKEQLNALNLPSKYQVRQPKPSSALFNYVYVIPVTDTACIDSLTAVLEDVPDKNALLSPVKQQLTLGKQQYQRYLALDEHGLGPNDAHALEQDADNYEQYYRLMESYIYQIEEDLPLIDYTVDNLIIINMSVALENLFAPLQTQLSAGPTYQYMGRLNPVFEIHAQTTSRETIEQLCKIYATSQRYAREYRVAIVSGYVGIKCDLADLIGVDAVLFDALKIDTIPNMPGVFDVTMSLIAFNKKQKRTEAIERFEGVDTSKIKSRFDLPIANQPNSIGYEPIIFEQKMKQMELYPDLELPTYSMLNMALPFINAGITTYPNPHLAKFLDPDFYVACPTTLRTILVDRVASFGKASNTLELTDFAGYSMTIKEPSSDDASVSDVISFSDNFLQHVADNKDIYSPLPASDYNTTAPDAGNSTAFDATTSPSTSSSATSVLGPVASATVNNTSSAILPTIQYKDKIPTSKLRQVPCTRTAFNGGVNDFIEFMKPYAIEACKRYGLLPSILIAQAGKESGWGKKSYNYNLFGVTTSRYATNVWDGEYFISKGNNHHFKAYKSYADSIADYADLIGTNDRYREALMKPTYSEMAYAIQEAGYAGKDNKDYAPGLIKIIQQRKLDKIDAEVAGIRSARLAMTPVNSTSNNSNTNTDQDTQSSFPKDYTPDFRSEGYRASTEYKQALANGIVFTTLGDRAVNTTGIPDIWQRSVYVRTDYWSGLFGHFRSNLVAWLEDQDQVQTQNTECLEVYKFEEAEYPTVYVRRRNKADFEGKYWRHYPMNTPLPGMKDGPKPGGFYSTVKGMFVDMCEYDMRNRFIRVFPSFNVLLIDEGRWMSWYKMWDNFYGFNSIISIDVFKSRKMAADTCVIEMSNIYSNLVSRDVEGKYDDTEWKWYNIFNFTDMDKFHEAWGALKGQPTESIISGRKEAVNQLVMRPGARIHLRMGYGANAYDLPIVFNGTVTEVNVDEQVTMIAQGDGLELTHKLPNQKRDATTKLEPRAALCDFLTDSGGWNTFLQQLTTNEPVIIPDKIKSNIVHFGQTGYLPPALHPTLQFVGKTLRGIIGGTILTLVGQFDKAQELANSLKNEQQYAYDIYGLPWDDYGEPGVNIYCGAGIETFDEIYYTVPLETTNGETLQYPAKIGAKEGGLHFLWDILSHVFSNVSWFSKGDQPNIGVYTYDRSFWDVANTYAACIPDYIVGVVPFELRSTVFFGKPTWGLLYKYIYEYVKDGNELRSYVRKAVRKTYAQIHCYHSGMDIISNNIRATADNVYTNVIVTYNGTNKDGIADQKNSKKISADTDIYPEFQKTSIVHIDINAASDDDKLAENAGISILKNYLKDMYDGEFIVIGDPTVKPHDIMHITDQYVDMQGYAGVKQVIHHMSCDSGFITNIKPDAIVEGKYRELATALSMATMIAQDVVSTSVMLTLTHIVGRWIIGIPYAEYAAKGYSFVAKNIVKGMSLGLQDGSDVAKLMAEVAEKVGKLDFNDAVAHLTANKTILAQGYNNPDRIINFIKGMGNIKNTSATYYGKVMDFFKAGTTAAFLGRMAVDAAIAITMMIIADSIGDWLTTTLLNRQACMVIPLTYQGSPLTAGVTGSQGLIAGQQPGTVDKFLMKFFDSSITHLLFGLFGINYEVPNYDNSKVRIGE